MFKNARFVAVAIAVLAGGLGWAAFRFWRPSSGGSVSRFAAKPALPATLDEAPAQVRDFLHRVLDKLPEAGSALSEYEFHDWRSDEKPTHEVVGLKPIAGVAPDALIARVMDVDGYARNIAYVETCHAIEDSAFVPPEKVRFYQKINVPGLARVQQELVLVDAGTIKGYRVAYWYLLKDKTDALNSKAAARSEFNVGAWIASPGAVGYALSSWPKREDVNAIQWFSMTSGTNALAKKIVETNIDGMAKWAKRPSEVASQRP